MKQDANPIIISIPARKRMLSEVSNSSDESDTNSSEDDDPPNKRRKLNPSTQSLPVTTFV